MTSTRGPDPADLWRRLTPAARRLLRLVARPEKFTRKDRRKFAAVAASELDRRIAYLRTDIKNGFGDVAEHRFIELWDAGNN